MDIVENRRGAWLVDNGVVLSEVLHEPRATGSVFDLLAASIAALSPGPRCALLGFAAGGVVAPLRAMGFQHPIDAVDLSRRGERVFRRISRFPVDDVRVFQGEASAWLRRRRKPYDLIVDDLSVRHATHQAVKPQVSLAVLPELIPRRLTPRGVAVFNLLSSPTLSWSALLSQIGAHFASSLLLDCDDYENRLLIAGARLPSARSLSPRLRGLLRAVGSRQAGRFSVRRME